MNYLSGGETDGTSFLLESPRGFYSSTHSPSSPSSSSGKLATVVVVLIAGLSFLLCIPSFILFQHHLKNALDSQRGVATDEYDVNEDDDKPNFSSSSSSSYTNSFDHSLYLESHYQIWSKLSLRYWLPLTLIAGVVSISVILLKRRRSILKRHCQLHLHDHQHHLPLVSSPSHHPASSVSHTAPTATTTSLMTGVTSDVVSDAATTIGAVTSDAESARRSANYGGFEDHHTQYHNNGDVCFNNQLVLPQQQQQHQHHNQQLQQQQPLLSSMMTSTSSAAGSSDIDDYNNPSTSALPLSSASDGADNDDNDDDDDEMKKLSSVFRRELGFLQCCAAKLLFFLFFALPHFVLSTILFLETGHLDVFSVLRDTKVDYGIWNRERRGGVVADGDAIAPELSVAHSVVCLTTILIALQSVMSFFVFILGSALVRRHFKRAFRVWCQRSGKKM